MYGMRELSMLFMSLTLGCAMGTSAPTNADAASEGGALVVDDAAMDSTSTASFDAPDASSDVGFPAGEGVRTAVDRTEPCTPAEAGSFRPSPVDGSVAQACLPSYNVWAPVVCGGPRPACACDASHCLPGEAAKLVSSEFCVCLSPCTTQASGARCGPMSSRKCIPVDDVTKRQVFICGGSG